MANPVLVAPHRGWVEEYRWGHPEARHWAVHDTTQLAHSLPWRYSFRSEGHCADDDYTRYVPCAASKPRAS